MSGSLRACLGIVLLVWSADGALRRETFDREPPFWEGINNRNTNFPKRVVIQDFGYNPRANHTGASPGEVGGRIYPAGEAA